MLLGLHPGCSQTQLADCRNTEASREQPPRAGAVLHTWAPRSHTPAEQTKGTK